MINSIFLQYKVLRGKNKVKFRILIQRNVSHLLRIFYLINVSFFMFWKSSVFIE